MEATRIKRIIASVLLAIAGGFYTSKMLWFGGAFAGAGHGTAFFAYIVAGPYGACLPIWPLSAGLIPWRRHKWVSAVLALLAVFPIACAWYAYGQLADDAPYLNKVWRQLHTLALVFLGLFVLPTIVCLTFVLRAFFFARLSAKNQDAGIKIVGPEHG